MYCIMCGARQEPVGNFCAVCGVKMAREVPLELKQTPSINPPAPPLKENPPVLESSVEATPPMLPEGNNLPEGEASAAEVPPAESGIRETESDSVWSEEAPSSVDVPATEGPLTSRVKKVWIPVISLISLLVVALLWGWLNRSHPVAPAIPMVQKEAESAPPSIPTTPAIDDLAKNTIGRMAAILEGIQRYAEKNRGALPHSLTDLNRGYSKSEAIQDAWGRDLHYLVDLNHQSFLLRSAGPDGMRETSDDLVVTNEDGENWVSKNMQIIQEWNAANPNQYAQLKAVGPSAEELKKPEDARKAEEEKKRQEALVSAESRRLEEERHRQEQLRQEEEKKRQQEQARKDEEQRHARAREEATRQHQELLHSMNITEDFSAGLARWDAPESWSLIREKSTPLLRVQGLGLLKAGQNWENYQVEFDIRIDKEAGGWMVRARDGRSFYFFKLSSEKAKAVPKNSLIRYILIDGKYLNPLQEDDAPGAAAITPLKFKIRNKDFYRVRVIVRGRQISHFIDENPVDNFEDDTFTHGRFGFNVSSIESAAVQNVRIQPVE